MKVSNQLIIAPLLLTVLPSEAAVVFTSATGVPGTASVNTDLFQTSLTSTSWPTNNNINNGTTGAFNEASGANPANVTGSGTYTFALNVGMNPLGYDITSINSFSGWNDNRAGQSYTIFFSTVANPTIFNQITPSGTGSNAVSVGAVGNSLVTSVSDNTSVPLGTGVHSIRFNVGVNGDGNVWREIDAIGVATMLGANGTWNGISGNWTDATVSGGVWSGGTIADGIGFSANFTGTDITTDQSIALNGNRTIGNITFTDATTSSNNLAITGNILTLDRTNLDVPVIDVTQADRTLTIGSVVAGTDGLQKNGLGNLTLTGANTFTGTTTINGGTLQIGNGGATGSLYSATVSGGVTPGNLTFGSASSIVNNGTLVYNMVGGAVNVNRTISGSGTVSVTGNQAVNFADGTTINTSGSQTYSATQTAATRYHGYTLTDNATVALTSSAGNISMTGMLGTANGNSGNLNINTSAGNGNVTLNVAVGVSNVNFGLNSLNINAGTGTISLGVFNSTNWRRASTISLTGGAINSTVNMTDFSTLTVTNSSSSLFSGTLSSGGALTKSGAGTLTLSSQNSFSGALTINGGIVEFSNAGTVNGGAYNVYGSTQININNGATLRVSGNSSGANIEIFNGRNYTFDSGGGGSILLGTGNYNAVSTAFSITTNGGARNNIGLITTSGAFGFNIGSTVATFNVALGSDATSDLTVTPIIANGGSIVKSGAGRLTFTASNTYSGGTRIDNGTLTLGHATDTLANGGAVNVNGGTLALGTNTDTVGAVTLTSGSITGTGTGRLTGTVSAFDVRSGTISAKLGGTVGLTKTTGGTVTISSDNSSGGYTGATLVSAGSLVIDGNISTSITTVSGGTLGGIGTVGATDVQAGGTLAPGNSIGTLNVTNTLTLAGIANFEIDPTLSLGLNADRANVIGVGSSVTYGGTLNVLYGGLNTGFADGMVFNLFDASSFSGTFTTVILPSLTGTGLSWQNDLLTNGTLTVIPEPNVAALIGAFGGILLLRRRRN